MKNILIVVFVLTLAMTLSRVAKAQPVEEDFINWNQFNFTTKWWDGKYVANLELQDRWNNDAGRLNQLIARPAIGTRINKHWYVWVGYGYIGNYVGDGKFNDEHRVFEQLTYDDVFSKFKVNARTRFEQRNFDYGDLTTGLRARQMLRGEMYVHGKVYLAAWDEIFFNLNDYGGTNKAGFDRNRLFLGVGYDGVLPGTKLEVGYIQQYRNNHGQPDSLDNGVMTSATVKF